MVTLWPGLLADGHSLGPGDGGRRADGIKTVLNEFVAYFRLAALPDDALDPRSRLIMAYALCGLANFGSLGIMIAGLTVMATKRRDEIVSLGWKSIVSGTLSTCLLGAIVGTLR